MAQEMTTCASKIAVIGSGFAGLAAAAILARAGNSVTVFEKNPTPGGRARIFESNGFKFDMGPSWYWMPDIFEAFFNLFGKSVSDFYQLRRLSPAYQIYYGANNLFPVPSNLDELKQIFESIEAGSGKQFEKFMAEAAVKYKIGMERLVYKPGDSIREFVDPDVLSGLFKMNLLSSFHTHVRKYFRDSRLLRLMEFPVLFLGGTPKQIPALYSLMNHAGLALGTWYPMGGMIRVVEAMVDVARLQGVTFKNGAEVTGISVKDGKAQAVIVNGDSHDADAVIAAGDYHYIEQNLLPTEWRRYNQRYWNSRVLSPSSLIFYVGLNKKLHNLAHHTLFFDEDFDAHNAEIYETPSWPRQPLFYVCCPSRTDSSVAPSASENMFILIPIASGLQETEDLKETYFRMVIARIEKMTREAISGHVVYKRSYCLSDFRQDYHAFKGNAYGLANTLAQTAFRKPAMRSKVKNLFFAGQLTAPGPGVPPSLISGQVAAGLASKYLSDELR